MELRRTGDLYSNSLGESVDLEPDCLYPLLKSSDLANGTTDFTDRAMLVTQRMIGADTHCLSVSAPKTWDYLQRHADRLDRRASSIYQKRPRFSVFGVGEYSFSPWKVAISGLYKSLNFRVLGPVDGRPVVLDDTGNFIPCATREEAEFLAGLLNSPAAAEFFSAVIFWDAKRPVTVEILRKLDLLKLAEVFGKISEAEHYIQSSTHRKRTRASGAPVQTQALLF
jgi:hypothetical protein